MGEFMKDLVASAERGKKRKRLIEELTALDTEEHKIEKERKKRNAHLAYREKTVQKIVTHISERIARGATMGMTEFESMAVETPRPKAIPIEVKLLEDDHTALPKMITERLKLLGFKKCSVGYCEGQCHYMINNLKIVNQEEETAKQLRSSLKGTCGICYDNDVNVVILAPCGHITCTKCCTDFLKKDCPFCRETVENIQGAFPN